MSHAERSPKPLFTAAASVLVVSAVVAAVVLLRRQRSEDDGPAPIPPEQAQRLIERRNLALAHLENGRFADAAKGFAAIIDAVPSEPLGYRNRAIARVLAYVAAVTSEQRTSPQQTAELRSLAEQAVTADLKHEPDSAAAHFLASRLYFRIAEQHPAQDALRERRIAELKRAAECDPRAVFVWYELYRAYKLELDRRNARHAAESLKRAYELRPDNLVVLKDWLRTQHDHNDEGILATMQAAKVVVRPVVARYRRERGQEDLTAILETAIAGATAHDRERQRRIMGFTNIINALHATKLDRREVTPHELEFVMSDFSAAFYQRAQLPPAPIPPGIAVTMKPARPALAPPAPERVRALKLVDFDLDGRPDAIVAQGRFVRVYGLARPADAWTLLAERELPFEPHALAAADLDNDFASTAATVPTGPAKAPKPKRDHNAHKPPEPLGATADLDVVAWGPGGIAVLRNEISPQSGRRKLVPIKQPARFRKLKQIAALAVADFDHDSDLDLVLSTGQGMALWSNRGDAVFEDVTDYSSLPNPAEFKPTVLVPIDFNRDVHIDVVLGAGDSPAAYLQNVRHGQFRFKRFDAAFAPLADADALAPLEADGNASWDWIAAGKNGVTLVMTRSFNNGDYRFARSVKVHETPVAGARLWDYDNDGYQDVLAWGPDGFVAYRGGPEGRFARADELFPAEKDVAAADVADVDGDGDLDVVAIVANRLALYLNDGGNRNNYLDVELHAQTRDVKLTEQRCNIHGLGSLLELAAGNRYQARIVTGPVTHFGLGDNKRADVVRVLWTNGIPQNVIRPRARERVRSRQKLLKGSCPYLYAWNGRRYTFVTDLLWAAPLGLQTADGLVAPARNREFLKIPGEQLAPADGEYRLQITEELWEAGYFDSVRLYAIDHPADVQVFTNEKVGPAAIAREKVHTVRRPRLPVTARDQTGRDVLPLIAARDDRYLQAYDGRLTQGLTREHYLELDLGRLHNPHRIRLFLTGWLFPTDTSINVWLSHHPRLSAPQPPSLWVPDKNGRWKNVIPYLGFPGGKTKTIAVDLSHAFLTDDYRLRIKTTMELRWDAAFFTVDERPAPYRRIELPLRRANLSYRGFSKRIERPHGAPETYDFHSVDPWPHWPPMDGCLTRYGDVTELLQSDDDRLVVLGSGDAIDLRFEAPREKLPSGWKRDFIIRNVGWDKDADLNTVLGQTVDPLPFGKMKRYPPPPDQSAPHTAAYREYLKTYKTRRQRSARFWRLISSGRGRNKTPPDRER